MPADLSNLEPRLRVVLEQLPAVVWTMDRDLDITSMVGSRSSLIEKARLTLSECDASPTPAVEHCRRVLSGESLTVEMDLDGVAYQARLQPLRDSKGEVQGVVGCVLDLSHRRELEQQFHAAQRMESVGRLAGGIAHDFNNVLTIIECYSKFLLDDAQSGSPSHDDIRQIQEAARRAAGLVAHLLAFSRRQVQELEVIDLNTIIRDVEDMLSRSIGEDIEINTHLDASLRLVKADRAQVEQILLNLAVNARDAMPGGGQLTIESTPCRLDDDYAASHVAVVPGPYSLISVTDTGTGMDEATVHRIFDPFFTTKEGSKGTGLGLSTVYGIVKQNGGNIWVYTEPGVGTTFKIYLPSVNEPASQRMAAVPLPSDLSGSETILLVEDDDALRGAAQRTLVAHGYKVLSASSAREALDLAASYAGEIHLLLTDVVMPHMSGKELSDRIGPARPQMSILYTSGFAEHAVVQHSVVDEGAAFLPKPYAPQMLLTEVRMQLDTGAPANRP